MRLRRYSSIIILIAFSSAEGFAQTPPPKSVVSVQVNAGNSTGPYEAVWSFFGADEPNYSYAANGQQLLRELSQLSSAPVYVRLHNLLTTGDGSGALKWGSTNVYR